VSAAPGVGDALGLTTEGVLSRTVEDAAIVLDAMAGAEPGDPCAAPPPRTPFVLAARRDPAAPLRVGVTVQAPNAAPVHPDCVRAAREAGELVASLGHEVIEVAPEWGGNEAMERFVSYWTTGVGPALDGLDSLVGRRLDRSLLEPLTRELVQRAEHISAGSYVRDFAWLRAFARRLGAAFESFDVLVTPTLAHLPPEIGALAPGPGEPAAQLLWTVAGWVPFTPPWNVTGQPAMSLPLAQSSEGLPVGVQLVGPPAGEEPLLELAGQVERAAPWQGRRPPIWAWS
jgi:amidase